MGGDLDRGAPRLRRALAVLAAVLALAVAAVLALVVVGPVLVGATPADRADARNVEVVSAARRLTADLFNADYRSIGQQVDGVAASATGEFAREWESSESTYVETFTAAKREVAATIRGIGLIEADDREASVTIALDTATTDSAGARGASGTARIRKLALAMSLRRVDGAWAISRMEVLQ